MKVRLSSVVSYFNNRDRFKRIILMRKLHTYYLKEKEIPEV